jgi:dephospho-CoA kinase
MLRRKEGAMPATERPSRRVIGLAGSAGSGKSWLSERLAERMDFEYLGIDNFGRPGTNRWPKLMRAIKAIDHGTVLVESVAAPKAYRNLVDLLIVFKVPPRIRRERLLRRGESPKEARRLVRDCQRAARRGDLTVGPDIDSTGMDLVAETIRQTDLALQAGLRVGGDLRAKSNGHRANFSRAPKPF